MQILDEPAMLDFGKQFAKNFIFDRQNPVKSAKNHPKSPNTAHAIVLELIGDVGTGKTTFTRGLAESLGISTPVTSPSYTISRAYALKNGGELIHYDFYRLSDPGLMQDDLAEALENPQNIVVIEWGASVKDLLPPSHTTLTFTYKDDGSREVTISTPDTILPTPNTSSELPS